MGLAFFFVGASTQAALNIYLRAFLQIFAGDLRQAVIEGDAVPFGALLLLTALLVLPASLVAMRMLVTALPKCMSRVSGSAPRFLTNMTLFTPRDMTHSSYLGCIPARFLAD